MTEQPEKAPENVSPWISDADLWWASTLPRSDLEHSAVVTSSPCSERVRFIEPCFERVGTATLLGEEEDDTLPQFLSALEHAHLEEQPEVVQDDLPCLLMLAQEWEEMCHENASQSTTATVLEEQNQGSEVQGPHFRSFEEEMGPTNDGVWGSEEGSASPSEALVSVTEEPRLFRVFVGRRQPDDNETLPVLTETEHPGQPVCLHSGQKTCGTLIPPAVNNCDSGDRFSVSTVPHGQPVSSSLAVREGHCGPFDRECSARLLPAVTVDPQLSGDETPKALQSQLTAAIPPRTIQANPFPLQHHDRASLPSFPSVSVRDVERRRHFCRELQVFFSSLIRHNFMVC